MTDKRLTDLADDMMQFAAQTFADKGQVHAMWHAVDANGDVMIIMSPFNGDTFEESVENKDKVAMGLRVLFRERGVTHYGFVSEAWMLDAKNRRDLPDGSFEHVPGRKEILMVVVENAAHESFGLMAEIIRPKRGKPTLAKPEKLDGGNEGRFSKLLDYNPNLGLQ